MKDIIKDTVAGILGGLVLVAGICLVCWICIPSEAKESKQHIATITQYENTIIGDDAGGIIDFTDPQTGVCYFIYKDGYHGMGQGGMTVRYNADGSIMVRDINVIEKIEEESER